MQYRAYISLFVFIFTICFIFYGFKKKPQYKTSRLKVKLDYATTPIIGVLILVCTLSIDLETLFKGIIGTTEIQPFAIIILFMSIAYICLSLDITGFFEYLALKAVKASGTSTKKLFYYFFFLSSVLTIFTSNDIVILTITPIIIYFSKHTKIDPVPFLITQFFAANIWSITLFIGNPTNIIVGEAFNLQFIEYTLWMVLPTIVAGTSCLFLLWFLFRNEIPKQFEAPEIIPTNALRDKSGAVFNLIILISCLILITFGSIVNFPLWIISISLALVIFCRTLIFDFLKNHHKAFKPNSTLFNSLKRMPWKILPFILGMFIIVEALVETGWITGLSDAFQGLYSNLLIAIISITFLSALSCNLMNNQPMTILFTQILLYDSFSLSESVKLGVVYSLIMGSNFGANFTLLGALAGIMWHKIISDKDVNISYGKFAKYGFLITPIVILLSCFMLIAEILIVF